MIRANDSDRDLVIEILTNSFCDNKSVNYIIKQGGRKIIRIRKLMGYSFDMCRLFGEVLLSEEKTGCALLAFPDKRKTTFKSVFLDLRLIMGCIGISNAKKAIDRELKIRKLHSQERICHLWFIGVALKGQNNGIGSKLLNDVIKHAHTQNRSIFLETSTLKNLPWYQKFGFEIYGEINLGYALFFLKNKPHQYASSRYTNAYCNI